MNFNLLAGLYNYSVIPFWLFTKISEYDPRVFSSSGVIAILLWGTAYISMIPFSDISEIYLVFFFEKLTYVYLWFDWHYLNSSRLSKIYEESKLTALFFVVYGIGDLIFSLGFLVKFIRLKKMLLVSDHIKHNL